VKPRYAFAAAGYVVFGLAFAAYWRPPRGWDRIRVDWMQQRAAAALREVAGIDVTGWARSIEARLDPVHERWQQRHARVPIDRMLTPLGVTFRFRNRDEDVAVTLSVDGRPRRIRRNDHSPRRPPEPDPDAVAETAMRVLTGEFAGEFRRDNSDRGQPFRWKAVSPSDRAHSWVATVDFDEGRFQSAELEPRFEDRRRRGFAREGQFFESEGYNLAQGVVLFGGGMWAVMAYLMGWARGAIRHKLALAAGTGFAAFEAIEYVGEGLPFHWAMIARCLGAGLMAVVLTGPGRSAASGNQWPRWTEFVRFLRGQWTARPVGSAIFGGLVWAGAVACIPFAMMAVVPIGGAAPAVTRFMDAALARWPIVNAVAPLMEHQSYGLFVFFLPVFVRRIQGRRAVPVIFAAVAAALLFVLLNPFAAGVPVSVATAIASAVLLTWVYWSEGLLTVLVAMKGAAVLVLAASFLRAGEWLLPAGVGLLALLAVAFVMAAFWALHGKECDPLEDELDAAFIPERERLKAEFSLAQRAQQVLLPAAPPALPGFSLAAACLPARDVGGDLYDYYGMANGRLGLCVADVSGKGVAAALYMTLTKGILAAAGPECDDVAELARHANRHIYAAGRRKVFVTAVFASLDPQSRTVEYVRAGHNPVLHRSGLDGETRYLQAPGMGLGMTNGVLFDRVTRVEKVTLAEGDSLVIYSDGVTEAMNAALEQYGEDRLLRLVRDSGSGDAAALVEAIRRDVAAFAGAQPPHDDITVLVLKA
jgi:sigma-B regulation protein RsbU (phosphoserine phosphatase)